VTLLLVALVPSVPVCGAEAEPEKPGEEARSEVEEKENCAECAAEAGESMPPVTESLPCGRGELACRACRWAR
jgi:hypothetical protein